MLSCSDEKYDAIKTIIPEAAHNIEENSMLEHKSPLCRFLILLN